jgi:Asp-tRNA(Asn)/Glu-tRNA(Gln) amidotransferase A subunit family amidase
VTEDTHFTGAAAQPGAAERLESCIAQIEFREPSLKAFSHIDLDAARREALRLDALPPSERGPLHGIPVGVKEIFDVAGLRCGWGSPIHEGRVPATDAVAVARLRAAGAVVIGTTASTEYAMARHAATVNPFDPARTPGASSSGSAAAVGAGLVPCALGSQTIGSGIRPAAYCGVLAFKASWGVWPLDGAMPLSQCLDHPVIMAKSPDLLEAMWAAMSGLRELPPAPARRKPDGVSVISLDPWFVDPLSHAVTQAMDIAADALRRQGASVTTASITDIVAGEQGCLTRILSHDMARHHGGDYDRAGELMSPSLRQWIEMGREVTPEQYEAALAERRRLIGEMEAWLPGNAILLTAATVDVAPIRSAGTGSRAPQRLWSLLGFPAMAVPVSQERGLPVGVQLIAGPGRDRALLTVGRQLWEALHRVGAGS